MHAVDEIDVRVTAGAEQHARAGCEASIGVSGTVALAEVLAYVSFHFDDATGADRPARGLVNEDLA